MNANLDARFLGSWSSEKTGNLLYFTFQKISFVNLATKATDSFLQGTFIMAPYLLPSIDTEIGVFITYHGVKIDLVYEDASVPVQTYIYTFSDDSTKLYLADFEGNIVLEFLRAMVEEETVDYYVKTA